MQASTQRSDGTSRCVVSSENDNCSFLVCAGADGHRASSDFVLSLDQFVTEHQAYFKSDKCRDLDRHIGDLQSFVSGAARFPRFA